MAKSYVATERKRCMVCGTLYRTGALLIHKARPVRRANPEWALCQKHQLYRDRNFIALVEVDPTSSNIVDDYHLMPEDAARTGTVIYLQRTVFRQFFHDEPPDNGVCYVPPEVIALLQRFKHRAQGREDN